MAGASSETGYLNIGTAETSSHPEIEPEIEAIEATGDFDEVSETGKTKKPKSPAPKCTFKGLREAADDSDWFRALEYFDCNALMSLLQVNPCLVAQTGPERWTVLHVAVRMGCMQLLDQVFDIFKDKHSVDCTRRWIQFVDEASGVNLYLNDLLEAKCGAYEVLAEDIAWFTCSAPVQKVLREGERSDGKSFSSMQRSRSNESQDSRDKLVEIMQRESSKEAFENLKERCQNETLENFVSECIELQFHYACQNLFSDEAINYVKTIIGGCLELGPLKSVEVLTYLFQLPNARGKTPLHVAFSAEKCQKLLEVVPPGDVYKVCVNAKDVRGWTVLHCAAVRNAYALLELLLNDEQVDVNTKNTSDTLEPGLTALHLAILHNRVKSVKLLLQCSRTDVNAELYRGILCGYATMRPGDDEYDSDDEYDNEKGILYWSPLQLAAIMGLTEVVRALFDSERDDIFDSGKLQNTKTSTKGGPKANLISALLYASASGKPDTLRLFLDNQTFNPSVKYEGATALHYATNAMIPRTSHMRRQHFDDVENLNVGQFLLFQDLGYLDRNPRKYIKELKDKKLIPTSYLGRQACITMLLQVGVDIWEKDKKKRFAEPGPQASEEALLWWHDRIARETFESKKSLNDAANAISVVAALVATASFVGPLQPPLGYGGNSMEGGVQDAHLSIRVFMVSNILSFYFAIASIMFAIVPSLPMPQEGIYVEWQRTRRSVGVAIFFLLMSVLGVLISFGTASNLVVSEDYSWQHAGLSFYPTLLGGFICILGISLFFIRLLRLVFHRNAKIRYLYKTFVKF